MKKSTKIMLIVSIACVFSGLALFAAAMTMIHWDLSELSNVRFETNTYDVTQSFDDLLINAKTDDISFILSDDKSCTVVCYEQENMKHTVKVKDNTLEISVNDTREWYEHIGIFMFDSPKTTIYLPKERYASLLIDSATGNIVIPKDLTFNSIDISGSTGSVRCDASSEGLTKIRLSTGDIKVSCVSSGEMDLTTSTGKIFMESVSSEGSITIGVSTGRTILTDVSCKSLEHKSSTGDISLKDVFSSELLHIKTSTGDVVFDGCDAGEIFVKTSTGDVTGSLLSEKVFITDTSTGDINVPKTVRGGKCEITTSTGDMRIRITDTQ